MPPSQSLTLFIRLAAGFGPGGELRERFRDVRGTSTGDEISSPWSVITPTVRSNVSAFRAESGAARIKSSRSSDPKSGEGERIPSRISRIEGPCVTLGMLSSENLISVVLPRPGSLETRELEELAREATDWEGSRTVFLRVSENSVSRAFGANLLEVGWIIRENPSLLAVFVFSDPALGFCGPFDLGGCGGFLNPSRQL